MMAQNWIGRYSYLSHKDFDPGRFGHQIIWDLFGSLLDLIHKIPPKQTIYSIHTKLHLQGTMPQAPTNSAL